MSSRGRTGRPVERLVRLGDLLSRGEWRRVLAMAGVVLALHVAGFFILIVLVAPHHYMLGASGTFTVGIGLTAYTLGLRHAFDADHIAAIDNTTRKLMAEGKRPLGVGFFFSLGHSSIVFGLSALFALGLRLLDSQVRNGSSTLHATTNLIGTGISAVFLFVIAALNVVVLAGIVRVFLDMRRGLYDGAALEHRLNARGLMNRLLGRLTSMVGESWQMYPIGVLFGLGFDTATEVALLFLAAGAAGAGLPFYAILCLPILFAAGMSLLDTVDGSFMSFAYGWASSKPVRRVYYNITVTALSIAVALLIGLVEILGLLATQLTLRHGFWGWVAGVNINALGFIIFGLFLLTWVLALAVWRFARIEERWNPRAHQAHRGDALS